MKKTLTLCILLAAICTLFIACANEECTHSYDNACDVVCNECSEERMITHDFAAADCTTPKTCKVCSATEGNALGHTPAADDGDCTTAVKCTFCEEVTTEAKPAHTPAADDGDCTTAVKCTLCEKVTIEAKPAHTPATDDGDCTTALECTVCEKNAKEAKNEHTPKEDDNDCATALTCNFCDHIFTEAKEHEFSKSFNATHEAHWYICLNEGCEVKNLFANHTPEDDDGDCTTDILCKVCGWGVESGNEEHTPEADDGDCTTPVKCIHCDIYVIEAKTEHNSEGDDGDCTTALRCSDCTKNVLEARDEHIDENIDGKCDFCDYSFDYIYDEEINTYIVFTAEGLYEWADNTWKSVNLMLGKDIVMPSEMNFDLDEDGINESNWEPTSFWNTIDGNGYSIIGMVIKPKERDHAAFVSSLNQDGIIRNLNFSDANISTEGINIAVIVGYNSGLIENCNAGGEVYVKGNNVGGIAGTNSGKIIACHNDADISATSGVVGGIVGQNGINSDFVIACSNTGVITSDDSTVGGIAGAFYGGNLIASYSTSEIVASYHCGAIVGYCGANLIENYWSTPSETLEYGTGNSETDDNAKKVDGENITWESAIISMNEEIKSAGYDYMYVINEADDKDIRPIVLITITE